MSWTIYFNSKQQTTWFPLQSKSPLESNALSHPSLPRFYALLEGFFLDALPFCHYTHLDGLHTFKTGPLDDHLQLGERKTSHRAIGSNVLLGQILRALWANNYLSCHISHLFSCTERSKCHRISFIDLLIVWLCGKNSFWTMPITSKNVNHPITFQRDCVQWLYIEKIKVGNFSLNIEVEKKHCLTKFRQVAETSIKNSKWGPELLIQNQVEI